jgi:nitrogen fixation protein FixH
MHWGAAIAAVYITFAGATVSFVVFAVGRPVELVSADYYEQSLKHDTHMQALANADALGNAVRVAVAEDARAIDVNVNADVTPAPARDISGTITLYRPSDRTADRVMPLSLDADGHQRVVVSGAARGRWVVKLTWRQAGQDFYREQAVLLP